MSALAFKSDSTRKAFYEEKPTVKPSLLKFNAFQARTTLRWKCHPNTRHSVPNRTFHRYECNKTSGLNKAPTGWP